MPSQNANKKPASVQPSVSRSVKSAWKKSIRELPLKQWARDLRNTLTQDNEHGHGDLAGLILTWLHNKKANTSKPTQGIGRTNRLGKGKK